MIVKVATDAHVVESAPTTNYAGSVYLALSNVASAKRYAYLYFAKPFPAGATILSAELNVYLRGAWAGTTTITARRITASWSESRITYNVKPAVTNTNASAQAVTGGASGQLVTIDIADMLQDVASGSGTFYGVRLEINGSSALAIHSTEAAEALRPTVDITWSEPPNDPDQLIPDGQKVSTGSPTLHWRFTDKVGNTQQASSQVQVATDSGFSSIVYDSTKVANLEALWDLSADGGWDAGDLTDGTTLYWRVKVWDATDFASDWSAGASMTRDNLGSLAITAPGSTVEDTTPTIAWTLTGETQSAYRVTLYRVNTNGSLTQLWRVHTAGTEDEVSVPNGYIVTGQTYRIVVEVWDEEDRALDDHLTEETDDFTYERDGSPDPVESLTVEADTDAPSVLLTWERSDAPDYWCLVVDGVEVLDRIDVSDTFVSGDEYSFRYWLAAPRQNHTYEVEAVVSTGGGPFLHSEDNPTGEATVNPIGIWLADPDDNLAVNIFGNDSVDLGIGENATTYFTVGGRSPVRITDSLRGYYGSVSGVVLSAEERDDFLELKSRLTELVLVVGDVTIPVRLEEVSASPTPIPNDVQYLVSFGFFQSGPPWPVEDV